MPCHCRTKITTTRRPALGRRRCRRTRVPGCVALRCRLALSCGVAEHERRLPQQGTPVHVGLACLVSRRSSRFLARGPPHHPAYPSHCSGSLLDPLPIYIPSAIMRRQTDCCRHPVGPARSYLLLLLYYPAQSGRLAAHHSRCFVLRFANLSSFTDLQTPHRSLLALPRNHVKQVLCWHGLQSEIRTATRAYRGGIHRKPQRLDDLATNTLAKGDLATSSCVWSTSKKMIYSPFRLAEGGSAK